MQKARDEMAAQIPTLEKYAAKAKERIAKNKGNEVGMEAMDRVPDLEDDLDNLKAEFDAMLKQMTKQ